MPDKDSKLSLDLITTSPNLASELDKEQLDKIGSKVIERFEKDVSSRQEWADIAEKAQNLASLKAEPKDHPWEGASNVKYPAITTAVTQFAARTIPEIVRGNKVVEVSVNGKNNEEKEARAKRVARHMSYQLLIESSDWEESVDKLIHIVALTGVGIKKTYFDPIQKKNISELLTHSDFVVNQHITSLPEARAATHVLNKHKNFLVSQMRAGLYEEINFKELVDNESSGHADGLTAEQNSEEDKEDFHELLEQHCYLDLDGDDYEEPYIVTVHRSSQKVLRIVARFDPEDVETNLDGDIIHIDPVHYFTDFHCIPATDGSFYSFGFGTLLYSLNEAINTTINQLIDSGTLANLQGGFLGKGLRIKGGAFRISPGEWKMLDSAMGQSIRENVFPVPYKEPSNVLFQLLGLLIETSKELSSVSDVLTGQQPAQNVPATTVLALVEQGLKVFNSIQKRLHRSFKKEFEKLYRLNRLFLDPEVYFRVQDEESAVLQADYEDETLDIIPVSDPNMSSDAQRFARDRAMLDVMQAPGVDGREVVRRYLEDLNVTDIDKILPPPDPNAPPSPEQVELQLDIQDKKDTHAENMRELDLKELDIRSKAQEREEKARAIEAKLEAEIQQIKATALDALARAEAAEQSTQLNFYKAQLETLKAKIGGFGDENIANEKIEQEAGLLEGQLDEQTSEAELAGPEGLEPGPSDEGPESLIETT